MEDNDDEEDELESIFGFVIIEWSLFFNFIDGDACWIRGIVVSLLLLLLIDNGGLFGGCCKVIFWSIGNGDIECCDDFGDEYDELFNPLLITLDGEDKISLFCIDEWWFDNAELFRIWLYDEDDKT